jgi:uncharacterized protein YegL
MPDRTKTEVAVILDRSGSMDSIRRDMERGFRTFVKKQRKAPGTCVLSLYQFDDRYDVVFEERALEDVTAIELVPRGSTALFDAVGHTIARIGERLRSKPEGQRPGTVVVMVITDGMENASCEYDATAVRELIARHERKHDWRFMFLGADAASVAEARDLGVRAAARYAKSAAGVADLYERSGTAVSRLRGQVHAGDASAALSLEEAGETTT